MKSRLHSPAATSPDSEKNTRSTQMTTTIIRDVQRLAHTPPFAADENHIAEKEKERGYEPLLLEVRVYV